MSEDKRKEKSGRFPRKYKSDFGDRCIAMALEGRFPVHWAVELGVTKSSLSKYRTQHPDFAEKYEYAKNILEGRMMDLILEGDAHDIHRGKWFMNTSFNVVEKSKAEVETKIDANVKQEVSVQFGEEDEL